jgi:hypothetical protein
MATKSAYADDHAAEIYRAMALRVFEHYVSLRSCAESHGAEMDNLGPYPTSWQVGEWYREALSEGVFEEPRTAAAASALAEFADLIAETRQREDGSIVGADADLMHQRIALTGVIQWLRPRTIDEAIAVERKLKLHGRELAGAEGVQ